MLTSDPYGDPEDTTTATLPAPPAVDSQSQVDPFGDPEAGAAVDPFGDPEAGAAVDPFGDPEAGPDTGMRGGMGENISAGTAKGILGVGATAGGLMQALGEFITGPDRQMIDPASNTRSTKPGPLAIVGRPVSWLGKKVTGFFEDKQDLLDQAWPQPSLVQPKPEGGYAVSDAWKDKRWWAQGVSSTMTQLVPQLMMAYASGGKTLLPSVFGAAQEAAPMYSRLRKEGLSSQEALLRSVAFGVAVARLEKLGLDNMLAGKGTLSAGKDVTLSLFNEGLEEWLENPAQALSEKLLRKGVSLSETGKAVVDSMATGVQDAIFGAVGGGVVRGGVRSVTPTMATTEDVEAGLIEDYGKDRVQRAGKGMWLIETPAGQKLAARVVDRSEQLTGGQDPVQTLASMEQGSAEARKAARSALETARGDRAAAGRALVAQGWSRQGQALPWIEIEVPQERPQGSDPATPPPQPKKLEVAGLLEIVAGRATVGTLGHERLHLLAIASGNNADSGMVTDPETGASIPEERLARAMDKGLDHPVIQRMKDFMLRMTAKYKKPGENLWQTANRATATWREQVGKGKGAVRKGTLSPAAAAALEAKARSTAQAFDERITQRDDPERGPIILPGPARTSGAGALLDQFGRPIPGTHVPMRDGKTQWQARTPQNEATVGGRWKVVEADTLRTSDRPDYDQALQPRNRNTLKSQEQIASIAKDPDPWQLMDSAGTDHGAPMIDAQGQVISGNGRVMGLRQAYAGNTATGYRLAVVERAKALGMPEADLMRQPILVREITDTGGKTMPDIAELSNRDRILRRTPAEQAEADGRMLRETGMLRSFNPDAVGTIRSPTNREFLAAFVNGSGDSALVDSKGQFSDEIESRVRRAMLAAITMEHPQGRQITQDLIERADTLRIQRQRDAVMAAAPAIMTATQGKPDYALEQDMAQALRDLVNFRKGVEDGSWQNDINQYLAQGDLFGDGRTPTSDMLLRTLVADPKVSTMRAFADAYAQAVNSMDTTGDDMFGATQRASREQVVLLALQKANPGARYAIGKATDRWSDATRVGKSFDNGRLRVYEVYRQGKPLYETQLRIRGHWRTIQYSNVRAEALELPNWNINGHDWYSFIEDAKRQPWFRQAVNDWAAIPNRASVETLGAEVGAPAIPFQNTPPTPQQENVAMAADDARYQVGKVIVKPRREMPAGLDAYYDADSDSIVVSEHLNPTERNRKIRHELTHRDQERAGTLPTSRFSGYDQGFVDYLSDPAEVAARASETGEPIPEIWQEVFRLREQKLSGQNEAAPLRVEQVSKVQTRRYVPSAPLPQGMSETDWQFGRLTPGWLAANRAPMPKVESVESVRIHLANNGNGIAAEALLQDAGFDAHSSAPFSVDVVIKRDGVVQEGNVRLLAERMPIQLRLGSGSSADNNARYQVGKTRGRGEYPVAGQAVDGRIVRDDIPNTSSIASSLDDYTVLPGIREVPMADFNITGKSYSEEGDRRIADLSAAIRASGEITPLIVVVDREGPYILEGATRIDALKRLGAKSFPALVVRDNVDGQARYQLGKERIHRTVPRLQSSVEYQAALTDAEKDPAAYYEQQLLAKTMQQFQDKAPEDLLNLPDAVNAFRLGEVDSASNFGPLAIAAAMEKYRAAGNTAKVRELALKLSRSMGVAAQMVRQMAALPGMAPQRIVDAIKDQAEAMGESLSESTLTTVYNLAEADITARQEMIEAEKKFVLQPTEANETKLRDATKKADQANRKMLRKVAEVTPRTWGNLIKTIMQGNVLTPVSIVANTTGNMVNLPMRWSRQSVAALTEQLLHAVGFVKTRTVTGPHVWAWARGLGQGAMAAPSILRTGIPAAELRPGGEIHRGFQPGRALIRALTERGRPGKAWTYGTLPAEPGPTPSQRAKLLVEGTLGAPAELAFRLLSATDVPFYQAAYTQAIEEIGELRGYGPAKMKQWTKAPDAEAKALAEERAAIAVYQGKSGALANTLQQLANSTLGIDPKENPEMADLVNAVAVRLFALFVRTPIQIAKEANAFLNPAAGAWGMVSNIRKGQQAKAKGDIAGMQRAQREALMSWGGLVTGTIVWSVVGAMVRAGVLAAPGGSDKERDLARLTLKPGHFNWSGFRRMLRGHDPSWQSGDTQVDYRAMGIIGLAMNMASTGAQILRNDAARNQQPFDQAGMGFWELTGTMPLTLPSAMLDMTMLKGAGMLMAGIERKRPQDAILQLFEAITAVPMPNTLKAASRVVLKDMPETEAQSRYDESMLQWRSMGREMVNRLETKLHIMRWAAAKAAGRPVPLRVEDVPLRLDLLGRPVPMTPAGRNPITYHLIDTPKASQIQAEPIIQEIDRVFRATNRRDAIPSRPSGTLTDPRTGKPIRLTEQQIQRWTEIHGLLTQWVIAAAIRQPDWPAATPDQQAEYLATLNGRVSTLSRIEMLRELGILPRY
jgi:hypothetical protein